MVGDGGVLLSFWGATKVHVGIDSFYEVSDNNQANLHLAQKCKKIALLQPKLANYLHVCSIIFGAWTRCIMCSNFEE